MIARLATTALFVAFASTLGACDDDSYSHAIVTNVINGNGAVLDFNRDGLVRIPEGTALTAHVAMYANDGDDMSGSLVSLDPAILQIDATTDDPGTYALIAAKAGSTTVRVIADDQTAVEVPVIVTAPSP